MLHLGTDSEGRPVGSVEPDEGQAASFVGWLALMAELARLLSDSTGGGPGAVGRKLPAN